VGLAKTRAKLIASTSARTSFLEHAKGLGLTDAYLFIGAEYSSQDDGLTIFSVPCARLEFVPGEWRAGEAISRTALALPNSMRR
jgi:hypothetical protein